MSFSRRAGLLGLGAALFLAACRSGGNNGSSPGTSRTTLEIASLAEPPNLVPHTPHGGKSHVYDAMLMLVLRTDDNNELFSNSLESWAVSDDARTVTLNLRPDIEWTDGTPMTSADVVMSLTQYLDPSISSYAPAIGGVVGQAAFADGTADTISGLSAPDDQTVVITLEEPNAAWLSNLAATEGMVILPAHVLGDVPHEQLEAHEYFRTFPVTNGPYTFVEWAAGQYVELARSETWSLGAAGFERVFIKFIESSVARAQLETREVQFLTNVPPADVEQVGSLDGIEVLSTGGETQNAWGLVYQEPLLDPRVRQAMVYAIDREEICRSVFQGHCEVSITNIPQVGPEWAIPTSDVTEYRYDPDRARELLAEAGWDPSTELVFLNWQEDGAMSQAFTIAQDNMADVGINWKIESVDLPTMHQRLEEEPESVHGYGNTGLNYVVEPDFIRQGLSCDARFPAGGNLSGYCNEEFDQLLAAGRVEVDPERRAEIYNDAFRLLNEEVPAINFAVMDSIAAYDSHLSGVKGHSGYGHKYWNIGEWRWEE